MILFVAYFLYDKSIKKMGLDIKKHPTGCFSSKITGSFIP